MRFKDESEFTDFMARRQEPKKPVAVAGHPLRLIIRLPFKLPTWNCLLAMDQWKRKKVRDQIHALVSIFIPAGSASLTQMEFQQRRQLTASSIAEYYAMMGQGKLRKSATVKSKPAKTKR